MINEEKLKAVLHSYKNCFQQRWKNGEDFKWKAIKQFQNHWDIDAEDFGEMFKTATDDTDTLLVSGYSFPRTMIINLAKADKEATRSMFRNLFDENVNLEARVNSFQRTAEELRVKYDDGTWWKHYQNTNAISTYLWLRYPDRYYIYKYEEIKAVAKELSGDYVPKRDGTAASMIGGFRFYDEICEVVKADSDIRNMLNDELSDDYYSDPEMKTITVDVGFYLSREYLKVRAMDRYKNKYSKQLLSAKNIIFRGAPGTGKSYLAKEIAADIISNGFTKRYADLTQEQKEQVEFVQFHPSYDYSDFVEGLRPKMNEDGSIGFELQDGIFKSFVDKARKNYENHNKSKEVREQELSAKELLAKFLSEIEFDKNEFQTITGNKFTVIDANDKHIYLSIPGNKTINKLTLNIDELRRMLESEINFEKVSDITDFFGKQFATQAYSYDFALYKEIKKGESEPQIQIVTEDLKEYVFIIDEINRGEISKIFGELFFSIDPGYRGKDGEVSTQYANMHIDPNERFYIPENVYIIGTMNDIDRSVDSFDFAMRRRFRFIEIKAEETQNDILQSLENEELKEDVIKRLNKLNEEILKADELNENYQIGAAYFLKLKTVGFDVLWTDYLRPLLQEYVRGLSNEDELMRKFSEAYGYPSLSTGDENEAVQD
ncbi:AAA domain (dynein-related subfamily) [Lachnospiraceae bacterium]|nr:AAA domain (dynein-related subfamily) [Lachnospiraceae bacterium]